MANNFTFVSPSVQIKIKDISFVNESIGLTTAGLVGETPKGPAFQAIPIDSKTKYRNMFGGKSTEKLGDKLKYTLPYYADSYLSESNQLYVTRVLGLSGYEVGAGWGIRISAGIDLTTTASTTTTTGTTTFTNSTFLGQTIIAQTGVTYNIEPDFVKINATDFTGSSTNYVIDNFEFVAGVGYTGNTTFSSTTITGTSYSEYENMLVAVLRTRGSYVGNTLVYDASAVTITGASTNVFDDFTITVNGSESYTVSLNPNASNFITKVLGDNEKDKATKVFVESTYPELIKKLENGGFAYGVNGTLVGLDVSNKADYAVPFRTPETPWVVSELRGNKLERLFKFVSISDGNSANKEIKISIQNINLSTREFDVVIRDFNDTDNNIVPLETFSRCSLNRELNTFIGKRIGDNNNYDNISSYVYLEFADIDSLNSDAIPAGFEGYNLRKYTSDVVDSSSAQTPTIFYKTSYSETDRLPRTYLGISERGYDLTNTTGKGVDQNFFNYAGVTSTSGLTKTKGFHMDSGATGTYTDGTYSLGEFETGAGDFKLASDVEVSTSPYFNRASRKFTLVPYGGFDGWDIYRDERTLSDTFRKGASNYTVNNDWDAYKKGIETFSNPEDFDMNVFATPGINWSDNEALVNEALDMVESRGDTFYVIDAPDLPNSETYSQDITDLLATTNFDTYLCGTAGPWVKVFDQDNNSNVYIPPTGDILRNMAFTDNVRFPWFAPAGLTRGLINAKDVRTKLKTTDRDTLYAGRINPILKKGSTIALYGQKTLQVRDSALDRMNVVRMLLYAAKLVSTISTQLLFDQNDDIVVGQFLDKVRPLLDTIVRERGLSEYKINYTGINTNESRDRNELYFDIYLKPIAALEFIGINFIVTPSGANFSLI